MFKKKHKHEYVDIGIFYKEYLTEYVNSFDQIIVYKRKKCIHCGDIYDEYVSREKFLPEMHYRDHKEKKKEYIDYIEKEYGCVLEIDLMLKEYK